MPQKPMISPSSRHRKSLVTSADRRRSVGYSRLRRPPSAARQAASSSSMAESCSSSRLPATSRCPEGELVAGALRDEVGAVPDEARLAAGGLVRVDDPLGGGFVDSLDGQAEKVTHLVRTGLGRLQGGL